MAESQAIESIATKIQVTETQLEKNDWTPTNNKKLNLVKIELLGFSHLGFGNGFSHHVIGQVS